MNKLKLLQTIQKAVKTKAFIATVTGVVVVGGVSTYAIINSQKKAEVANTSAYAVSDANKETDKIKIEDSKVEENKVADEEAKKKEEEKKKAEEEKIKSKNEAKEKADSEAKQKAEEEAKKKAEATTTNNSTSNTTPTSKPSTSSNTAAPNPSASTNTAPAPQPAPAPKPTRQSGIDEALTQKINAEHTIPYYTMQKSDPRTETMVSAAKTLAFGGAVPDNIKSEWKPYSNRNTIFKYRNHAVNIEVTNDTNYYYTRLPNIPGSCDGFNYCIAYWDASINSYKMYYIKIAMA